MRWSTCRCPGGPGSTWAFQGSTLEAAGKPGKGRAGQLAGLGSAGILARFHFSLLTQTGSSRLADRSNDLATFPAVILHVAMGKLSAKVPPTRHRAPCV